MSIVLNEYEWAEKMINSHDLGEKPVETLGRVSRYYYANHYNKKEIRELLDKFLMQCDPSVQLVKWSGTLDWVTRGAEKYPLAQIDNIDITADELNKIKTLRGKQLQRLAFTLLCLAKYWAEVYGKNGGWVNSKDNEIMKMANISTSVKRQSQMFSELRNAGFIKFSKRPDNLNIQVLFISDGESVIHIRDFRNLGYQYLKYRGEPYFECQNCGITVKVQNPSKGRPQKYCPNCAAEIKTRQTIDAVMRRRASKLS